MEPSARVVNHSGCSVTHGWSGEHCSARSIATSSPCRRASLTNARNVRSLPSSGWIASWPPSFDPMAYGLPGSPGSAVRELLRPLRCVVPMGWTGVR
ncbi:Uncharacterised protein [Mycobacteroides abscessus]|nr:Uncharacterised protein [Mycobacteroides abscessus]